MRLSISTKIILVFSSLTILVVIMGLVVKSNVISFEENSAQIESLKDFQIQIKALEAFSLFEADFTKPQLKVRILSELDKTDDIAGQFNTTTALLPEETRTALSDVKMVHLGYYRNALMEYHEKQLTKEKLLLENSRILRELHYHASTVTDPVQSIAIFKLLAALEHGWMKAYHSQSSNSLLDMKENLQELMTRINDDGLNKNIRQVIVNTEKTLLNYLALEDRRNFLKSTGTRFQEVADNTISVLAKINKEQQNTLQHQITGIIVFSLILTLILWLLSSRYLHRFLHNQHNAFTAIQAGQYDFQLIHPPNDELGDLMHFLRQVAHNLGETLGQLSESESKHRQLVENASDLVWETDSRGHFLYVSHSSEALLGINSDDMLEESLYRLFPEGEGDDKELTEKILNQAPFDSQESKFTWRDGRETVLETSGRPKIDRSGIFRGYHGISRDITERKREETLLEESRSFLQSVIDGVSDPIMVIDPDYKVSMMNAAAQKYSSTSLSQDDLFCHVVSHNSTTPCGDHGDLCPMTEIRNSGQPTTLSHEHTTADGTTTSHEIRAYPLFSPTGQFAGIIETMSDITDRMAMEKDLTRSKNFLTNIINSMPSSLLGVDAKGNITHWNTEAEKNTGVSRQEAIGKPFEEIYPFIGEHRAKLLFSIQSRQIQKSTQFVQADDGEMQCAEVIIYPLVANGVEGAVIRVDDVTDLVSLQQKISRTEEEKDLLQNQLVQAQKLESLGRLAGGVAHDFNNLLTGIIGYSELTMMQMDPHDPARENIKFIHEAGQKAEDLTRQLLTFSRKQVLSMGPINLDRVVEDLSKMLARMIGADIDLQLQLDPQNRTIMGDTGQIEQVLMNLAVNARDAMPGGGRLLIETSEAYVDGDQAANGEELKPGPHVVLTVSDTGTGIPPEVKDKIFEPFFTTKEVGKGTGLGLATVFGVVKQHKGHIWVHSEPDEGTTFRIYLPMIEAKPEAAAQQKNPQVATGTETILLVDDDSLSLKLLQDTLIPLGYSVLTATSGNAALELVEDTEQEIHLLLTDIIMPGMDGKALAERLLAKRTRMKVLFISGYTDNIITSLGVSTSRNIFFMPKPISPSLLADKIRRILNNAATPTTLPH